MQALILIYLSSGEDVHELMKKYDGLLNEHMENEVLIEHKKNEIEKQKR